jgi:acetoin utilization deacetylase AcuC-like enzyme
MLALYYDPIFLAHDTGAHPENAGRLRPLEQLDLFAEDSQITRQTWQPIALDRLLAVHDAEHIEKIKQFAGSGGGLIEADTVVSERSFDVARMAVGAVAAGVRYVVRGDATAALCLVRPPGHHAFADRPMGFCLFNNVALGARLACTEMGLDRVLIVDWDVHHGNGTQAIFWEDSRVGFFSMHRYPFYPGTGAASETGAGAGLGATCNLPLAMGISRHELIARFTNALQSFADRMRPQLILISAGFDAHRQDPIGSLGLESEDFATLTRIVADIADQHCQGKIVSVLEGGYHPAALAESVDAHWRELRAAGDADARHQ